MKIKANMKTDIEALEEKRTTIATGWVEIEGLIKFPVSVRTYKDDATGKDMMFVSYPQRKEGEKYYGVVYPHDKKVRQEIDRVVLDMTKEKLFAQSVPDVKIDDVRITKLDKRTDATVQNVGIATVKMYGLTINDIMIKEGKDGLFMRMPQYKSDGAYHDTVYGLTGAIKRKIESHVLDAYRNLVQDKQTEKTYRNTVHEEPEELQHEIEKNEKQEEIEEDREFHYTNDQAILLMPVHFEDKNRDGILFVAKNSDTRVDKTFMSGGYIRAQSFLIGEGENKVFGIFQNELNGTNNAPGKPLAIRQQILMQVTKDGVVQEPFIYASYSAIDMNSAVENYRRCLEQWAELTSQDYDKLLEAPQRNEEKKIRLSAVSV